MGKSPRGVKSGALVLAIGFLLSLAFVNFNPVAQAVNQFQPGPPPVTPNGYNFLKAETINRLLPNSPMLQYFYRLSSNEKFSRGFLTVVQYREWRKFWVLEIIALILMIVVKSWRMAMLDRDEWGARFWVSIWTTFVSAMLYFFLVPTLLFKREYVNLVWGFFEITFGFPKSNV